MSEIDGAWLARREDFMYATGTRTLNYSAAFKA